MDFETSQLMDEKLSKCKETCTKIDDEVFSVLRGKLDTSTFTWIFTGVTGVMITAISFLYGQMSTLQQKQTDMLFNMSNRLTAIETNTSNTSKQMEQLQNYFAQFNIKVK